MVLRGRGAVWVRVWGDVRGRHVLAAPETVCVRAADGVRFTREAWFARTRETVYARAMGGMRGYETRCACVLGVKGVGAGEGVKGRVCVRAKAAFEGAGDGEHARVGRHRFARRTAYMRTSHGLRVRE